MLGSTSILVTIFAFAGVSVAAETCTHEFFRPYYKTRSEFCEAGSMVTDFYTGKPILCEKTEVDHVVSLREAYLGGVCGDELKQLAKDPDNLRLTYWTTNRRKGAMSVEDFLKKEKLADEAQALGVAVKIRARYGVLSKEEAFSIRLATQLSGGGIAKRTVSLAAISSMEGIVEKQIGEHILFFSGKRLIGYAMNVGIAVDVITMIPDGITALGRAVSTDDEVRRADYIESLLE